MGADILVIDPDGSNLTNLTKDDEPGWQPDWSPDGEWILLARESSDPLDLWVMVLASENPEGFLW